MNKNLHFIIDEENINYKTTLKNIEMWSKLTDKSSKEIHIWLAYNLQSSFYKSKINKLKVKINIIQKNRILISNIIRSNNDGGIYVNFQIPLIKEFKEINLTTLFSKIFNKANSPEKFLLTLLPQNRRNDSVPTIGLLFWQNGQLMNINPQQFETISEETIYLIQRYQTQGLMESNLKLFSTFQLKYFKNQYNIMGSVTNKNDLRNIINTKNNFRVMEEERSLALAINNIMPSPEPSVGIHAHRRNTLLLNTIYRGLTDYIYLFETITPDEPNTAVHIESDTLQATICNKPICKHKIIQNCIRNSGSIYIFYPNKFLSVRITSSWRQKADNSVLVPGSTMHYKYSVILFLKDSSLNDYLYKAFSSALAENNINKFLILAKKMGLNS